MDFNLKSNITQECLYTDYRKHLRDVDGVDVITRYQTAPRRYLTISDAKPVCLNYHYANMFNGKMILRFDDYNLDADVEATEEMVLRDMELLGVVPHKITRMSDYIPAVIERIEELITSGFAYCDPSGVDAIEQAIKERACSAYRFVCPEQNMKIFKSMQEGKNLNYVVRARLDYVNLSHLLRDPIICVASDAVHPVSGKQNWVYPLRAVALPVMDSLEGCTHIFTQKEEYEYPVQYKWFVHKFSLKKVFVKEFVELKFENTSTNPETMRHLVNNRCVEGWNDLRLPTVASIMSRGVLQSTITEFMLEQGLSKKVNPVPWRTLWSLNKKNIMNIAFKFTAIKRSDAVIGSVVNFELEETREEMIKLAPKYEEAGMKPLYRTQQILMDKRELADLNVGDMIFLVRWGIFRILALKDENNNEHVKLEYHPDNEDVKDKPKVMWLALDPSKLVKVNIATLDVLFTDKNADEVENWKDTLSTESKTNEEYYSEGFLRTLKEGTIVQFEKGGFACLRKNPKKSSPSIIHDFIHIPDGKKKLAKAN